MHFFKLRKLGKACDSCGGSFAEKAFSTLIPEAEATRKDLCHSCFNQEKHDIWWQAPVVEKKSKSLYMTPYEKQLFDLFISALNDKNKSEHWVYFLAHYFKRRKLFLSQGECEKEGKVYEILESKETQEVFVVPKSVPSATDLKEIIQELNDVQPS